MIRKTYHKTIFFLQPWPRRVKMSVLKFFRICTCPQECDCQYPPPDDWDGKNGSFGVSNMCPIHNQDPYPDEDCPTHSY